ncbi:hypothetical protein OROGR_028250 [Orobanche gracilis]
MAQELIRGYGRKNISARCMIKMDLQKAYDSISWSFVESLLRSLGFPHPFVCWIVTCLTTVSYQICLNGQALESFEGKKGLRQGDPISPYLFVLCMEYLSRMMKKLQHHPSFRYHPMCNTFKITHLTFADDLLFFSKGTENPVAVLLEVFEQFSETSGLVANKNKCEIYFGGVTQAKRDSITVAAQIKEGSLPFRYLGRPLNAKRLSILQYQPLLEKMVAKVRHWTAKFLSYGGRVQLIKSVLYAIQNYWSQVLLFPKKVLVAIEAICRKFLWTGECGDSRKALVAWEELCRPKSEGGLGFMHLPSWNKTCFLKLLWALNSKAEKLWVRWIHGYYIKGQDVMHVDIPSQASYLIKKVLKVRQLVIGNGTWQKQVGEQKFEMSLIYREIWPPVQKVNWREYVLNNLATPRAQFILWLILRGRIATKSRLQKFGVQVDPICMFCGTEF